MDGDRRDLPTLPTLAPAGDPIVPVGTPAWPERFEVRGELGVGGMGVVYRAFDHRLQREIALKVVRGVPDGALKEARIGGRLEHPGIVSVHDAGALPDGGWLAMRLVRGEDLASVLARLRAGDAVWPRRRLVASLLRVAHAMAFAHAEGVVHLDLKPKNIRLGPFGDVIILDWGIASRVAERRRPAGTLGFAAPEQLDGAAPDPRADVYALGRILEQMLLITADDGLDEPLYTLRDATTARDAALRPADGAAVARALQAWLDGSTRRDAAEQLLAECRPLSEAAHASRIQAQSLRDEAARVLAAIPTWAPAERKVAGWRLHDRADQADARARRGALELELRLLEVLRHAPLPEARLKLGALLRERLLDAEARGDVATVAELEVRLTRLDAARHAGFVEGHGTLSLRTEPAGAQVIRQLETVVDRRLVAGPAESLGETPLTVDLPRGRHTIRLVAPGHIPVALPVRIDRDTTVGWTPPGDAVPAPLWLPPAGALSDAECYVPAGWFRSGGDPLATDGLPARQVWVDGFVIERDPLTYRRLIPALNALVDAGRVAEAARMAPPRFDPSGRNSDGHAGVTQDAQGRYALATVGDPAGAEDWPVTQLSWHAACAWADLRRAQTGQPWRLPHELEREKAARGVDGRRLPWGDHFEPTWSCNAQSREGPPTRAPVHAHPMDVSPYGVRGLTGNVRDWCLNRFHDPSVRLSARLVVATDPEQPGPRAIRGGAYGATPLVCHPAARYAAEPEGRYFFVGVRLARCVP